MTEGELIESTRKAIEEWGKLSADEIFRRLIAKGIINEKGEVLGMGGEDEKEEEEASRNGTPAPESPPPSA